ncbi:hypothetical protein [Thalassospira sp.]|uniref:hypothetical protein n=1 Tax=Thalassospira sp. TaxID=1912094 RepID=UPI00273574CB|nr:hypothetical protein [Thalassospira sp.]MDP2697590.1 hypothetical protein [Thalassospira sp.]
MRMRTYAILILIGAGAASIAALPYTPIPAHYHAFTDRLSALAGFGADRIRARVLPALEQELTEFGLAIGTPVYLRVFTLEKNLEVWLRANNGRYQLFKNLTLCGDDDSAARSLPENAGGVPVGIYRVSRDDLIPNSPHHLAVNLIPLPDSSPDTDNAQDQTAILQGACANETALALDNSDIEPVWLLVDAALRAGLPNVPVHVFDQQYQNDDVVDLGDDAMDAAPAPGLYDVYAAFERRRIPPDVHKTGGRYQVGNGG